MQLLNVFVPGMLNLKHREEEEGRSVVQGQDLIKKTNLCCRNKMDESQD